MNIIPASYRQFLYILATTLRHFFSNFSEILKFYNLTVGIVMYRRFYTVHNKLNIFFLKNIFYIMKNVFHRTKRHWPNIEIRLYFSFKADTEIKIIKHVYIIDLWCKTPHARNLQNQEGILYRPNFECVFCDEFSASLCI